MAMIDWPPGWQDEAVAVVSPFFGSDVRVRIIVGEPQASIDGSVLEGYLFLAPGGDPVIIYDHSEAPDVYPWKLLAGPVPQVSVQAPGKRRKVVYTHLAWAPPAAEHPGIPVKLLRLPAHRSAALGR
jgi:hypothetical protein